MFTGLVRATARLQRSASGVWIRGDLAALGPLQLGDSIAVDGVCLTVASLQPDGFGADVSEETLRRSNLAARALAGQRVNLEPALRLADRLGGHLVSGHVDGLGLVTGIAAEGGFWRLEIAWEDPALGRYICEKGSIAVDGISLTVADCTAAGDRFWMAVIPHTWQSTTLADRRVGDAVNLEADLLAKYSERLLEARFPRDSAGSGVGERPLDASWLAEQGWG
ncbi:MAG: riboflavin synthase [Cyanobium sp.]